MRSTIIAISTGIKKKKKTVIRTIRKVSVMNMVMALMLTISDDDDNDVHKRYKKRSQ